jgi:hypothetical protein
VGSQASSPPQPSESMPSPSPLTATASIVVEGVVSEAAQARVSESIQRYADDLSAKIREIEKNERVAGAENPEVTASTVIKASERLKEQPEGSKPSAMDIALRLIPPISSGAAGILGSYLNSLLQAAIFGAVAAIAVLSTVALVFRGGK